MQAFMVVSDSVPTSAILSFYFVSVLEVIINLALKYLTKCTKFYNNSRCRSWFIS